LTLAVEIAPSEAPVLIAGANGSGKEQELHVERRVQQ
jgi:DNA-binding NtrC family response regulator